MTRSLAETAALIFTSGYVARMPESLFESGRTLSVHIYDLAMNVSGGDGMAYSTALVLMVLLIVLNRSAMWVSRRWSLKKAVSA
jgi:phosphate transport system permease protein